MKKFILLLLVILLQIPLLVLGASENAYDFDLALEEVLDEVKRLDVSFFTKVSLRLKINNALTYSSQLYPYDIFDVDEIIDVMRESVDYGNTVGKTVSAVFAVDMAKKMELTQEQVVLVRKVLITGEGELVERGIPQEFLDTVATYGEYEVPPCCL